MSEVAPDIASNWLFDWVEGVPQPRNAKTLQKEQVQQLIAASGSCPYRGIWDPETQQYVMDDPEFEGATCLEVMTKKLILRAAEGDAKATEQVLDRILGKPKQAVESMSVHMDYLDFLEKSAQQEKPVGYFDVQVEDPDDDILKGV